MPEDRLETIARCRARDPFWAPVLYDEPPLCRCPEEEVYRFEWRSSFHGEATVRIGRQDEGIVARWEYRWCVPDGRPGKRRLDVREWNRLKDALDAAAFWSLDPNENRNMIVFDGARWVIEGRRAQDFHVVQRRSCETEGIDDLGRLFFDLAGPPLAAVRLY